MFQFRRFPTYTYLIQYTLPRGGFPHSEISGSQLICSSPKLIAAYHVLHRLLMPRHSPCALFRLTSPTRSPAPLGQTFQSWSNFLVLLKFELCRLIIGLVYPFQQNCNLPKLLVTFRNYSLNFLTVAFSSYAFLPRFLVAHTVRPYSLAFGLRTTIIASFLCSVFKIQSGLVASF